MPQFRTVAKILFALIATPLYAETNGVLRIGVLNDMSSVYSDFQGPGSVIAAQMSVDILQIFRLGAVDIAWKV